LVPTTPPGFRRERAREGILSGAQARALLASGQVIKAVETFDELLKTTVSPAWKDRINRELDEMAENF